MNTMHVIYLLIICSIFLPLFISSNEDFYQLLGITKSATQRDIRRAFKRIALEKHPDKRTVNKKLMELFFFVFSIVFYWF